MPQQSVVNRRADRTFGPGNRANDPVLDLVAAMKGESQEADRDLSGMSEEELVANAEELMAERQAAIDRTGLRKPRE